MTDFETDAETRAWETAAVANGVVLRGVDLNDVDDMKELYRVLDVKGMAAKTRLRAYIMDVQQQRQQRNQLSDAWFLVEGSIERDKSYIGLRYELIKKAAGGIYPKGMDIDSAFRVENHPKDTQRRLVFVAAVFLTKTMAYNFIASVEEYVATQRDLRFQHNFESKEIEAYNEEKLIRLTHYVPRDKYGIPPFDSPVWNVETMSMDLSALSPTTVYSRSDTVFKRQRIEVDIAFARSDPEGAHIFPKALCKGKYEWLDKQSFNRLALSKDGHSQFDGSGRGRGVTLNTVSKIALEPCNSEDIYIDRIAYKRIHLKLWCRDRKVAEAWRAFLDLNLVLKDFDHGYCYYEWVFIYCETGRTVKLQFEKQQDKDGSEQNVCITAIPGVIDHTTLNTWQEEDQTVAVFEVMECLLRWSYNRIRQVWREVGS